MPTHILGRSSTRGGLPGRSCQLSRARQFERLATHGHHPRTGLHICHQQPFNFLALHGQEPLHAGVIIIVPSVTPARQRELFSAALEHVGARDLTNTVVEVEYAGNRIVCSECALPGAAE
jgi:hypothetical protein